MEKLNNELFNIGNIKGPLVGLMGLSRSGKGVFTHQILKHSLIKEFDYFVYFNPSYFDEEIMKEFDWEHQRQILYTEPEQMTIEHVTKVLDGLKEYKKKNPWAKILILFDDMGAEMQEMKKKNIDFMKTVSTRGRHIGTVFVNLQDPIQISPLTRRSITSMVLFRTMDLITIEDYYKICALGMKKKEFVRFFLKHLGPKENKYKKLVVNKIEGTIHLAWGDEGQPIKYELVYDFNPLDIIT